MPFDRGTVSFRVCLLPQPMPEDALERFAAKAAGSLEHVTEEPQWGWVSARHLLERRIDEETAMLGGYLHLCLRQAQRKIPSALLRAECRMAELAIQAETKANSVNRNERRRIKEDVTARLLPQMPPQLSGIPFVIDANDKRLYVGALSQKQLDMFLELFCKTIGFEPIPLTPDVAASDLFTIDPDAAPQLNFSPDLADGNAAGTLGQNFLTWLWFYQDATDGVLPPSQLGAFSFMIDGPLVFVAEGQGAHESAIRKGMPTISAEAKAALHVGKKLKRAKIVLSQGRGTDWAVTVDADELTFRGMKLPEGEALDPASIFEERVTNLHVFQRVFYGLLQKFLTEVTDAQKCRTLQDHGKHWVKELVGR